ncbi:MAG: hypothetical protein QG608_867 [Actinomycetota bacterium]|nr:hypothetical protein [Actinomycetota bacterium]
MGVSEDPTRSTAGAFNLSTDAVPVPDRAVARSRRITPETVPDLPVLTERTRRRVPWGMVSSGSVVLLVACVWALGPLLPGHQDSSAPIPSLSIDGLSPEEAKLKNRPNPTASPTAGRENSTARTREQSPTPSLPSAPKPKPARTSSGPLQALPARTAPAPGEASTPQRLPSAARSTDVSGPTVSATPVLPIARPECTVALKGLRSRAEVHLLTLLVANPGPVSLNGWTVTGTLSGGHDVLWVRNGIVDASGLPTVHIGSTSQNDDIAPTRTTEIILAVGGPEQPPDLTGLSCAAN